MPRIGYIHSWSNTQNEGWVRAAFDTFGVPYTYFADIKLREGNLRQKYDVIVYPHVGGNAQSQVNGLPKTGGAPLPYKKTAETPNLGAHRSGRRHPRRNGLGRADGAGEVRPRGRHAASPKASTSTIFPEYNISNGVTVENPEGLFVRGSVMRGIVRGSPQPDRLRLRRAGAGLLQPGSGAECRRRRGSAAAGRGGDSWRRDERDADGQRAITGCRRTTPKRRSRLRPRRPPAAGADARAGRGGQRRRARRRPRRASAAPLTESPRVVLAFPSNPDEMLLSGVLVGGQALANRAQVVDIPVGQGHVVSFAIRPFWRWQTQGTFFLGLQHDPELERPRRRPADDEADVDTVIEETGVLAVSREDARRR